MEKELLFCIVADVGSRTVNLKGQQQKSMDSRALQ